jgi:hypothetical protein
MNLHAEWTIALACGLVAWSTEAPIFTWRGYSVYPTRLGGFLVTLYAIYHLIVG